MSTPTKLEWHVERIAWRDMIPYEHNPRKMSVKTKQKLRESYEKFGDVEIPVLDFDNMIIAGHQRHSVKIATGFGDELADVRKPNRKLTEQEYKEYNIISNALKGDFVGEMLAEHFAEVVELEDYGIQLDAIAKIHEKEATVDAKPELPIVQKMSEKYTAFVIVCTNEIDENFLAERFGIDRMQCYKSSNVGVSHVLDAKKVIELWK
ncbi:ParB N-terminal domain-containing protein [Flectobacillus roseus]|uniref:ParB/Sulfiredoxin domain-containing protein n=1 Tax=Flectobacillus roseus TaxID=502259 RepID=A0ABT6Y8J3_9BACT|nr:hypothetical protein [Flectobacillus roseus]MDI9859870.1 hypothetical protein [Flectobacillus roseus]